MLATDWNIPACYEELPVWVEPDGERSNIRFLSQGSRLLLNHSKSGSCRAQIERPRGYRTVAGDWVTLNPRLQQLSSQTERDEALVSTRSKHGTKSPPSGLQMAREITEWAETHQGKFGEKSVRHGLTEMDMSIVHAETLQAGSDAEDYKKFLEQLEIKANIKETRDTFPLWMVQLGLGCAILSTCWVGGHIGYKGFRIFRKSEGDSGLVKPCNASRRGRPIVQREQRGESSNTIGRSQTTQVNGSET